MIIIGDVLISEELLEEHFVCDLKACKGACCVEGEGGAPLTRAEGKVLEKIWPEVESYVTPKGAEEVKKQGFVVDEGDGFLETPLVNGRECVYANFENGIAYCGIERAWSEGKVAFRKPLSCQLYPIRVSKLGTFDALNYNRWNICSPACKLGNKLKVPVYQFLKEPLIRAYGETFYEELNKIAKSRKR